jgi:hypothetical protein
MTTCYQTIFKKSKCLAKSFDFNKNVIHIYIKQIFRAAAKAPPSPNIAVQGVG